MAYKLNADAPKIIAEACSNIGSQLIHLSTDYVFDHDGKELLDENLSMNPKSIYGKSKSLGEKYIIESTSKYIILRTSWIYSDIGKNFYLTIKNLLKSNNQIGVVNDQFGAPTLANDLVGGIIDIIKFIEDKKNKEIDLKNIYGVYNITNKGNISWFDFACKIAESLNHLSSERITAISSTEFGAAAPRPFNSRLDNSKLKKVFGIELINWESSFKNFLKTSNIRK